MTPPLSALARRLKTRFFFSDLEPTRRVLEIGCGSGWSLDYLRRRGFRDVRGIDLVPPADVVGDVRDWESLGLEPASFDAIVAFEVVEHVDCWNACLSLLKPGGRLFVTTPAPRWDWVCSLLERMGLSQRRTSPHAHLVDLRRAEGFRIARYARIALISQWGILEKAA